jgi:hypothetical protein
MSGIHEKPKLVSARSSMEEVFQKVGNPNVSEKFLKAIKKSFSSEIQNPNRFPIRLGMKQIRVSARRGHHHREVSHLGVWFSIISMASS